MARLIFILSLFFWGEFSWAWFQRETKRTPLTWEDSVHFETTPLCFPSVWFQQHFLGPKCVSFGGCDVMVEAKMGNQPLFSMRTRSHLCMVYDSC